MSALAEREIDANFDQTQFNLDVWDKIVDDPFYNSLAHRIETDRLGRILMTPPPWPEHGRSQFEIGFELRTRMDGGTTITECAVSTSEGVRAIDTVWISDIRWEDASGASALTIAPEICVEVLSESNSASEIDEKKHLYFEKKAEEVWVVPLSGKIAFFLRGDPKAEATSKLCPDFPKTIRYRS